MWKRSFLFFSKLSILLLTVLFISSCLEIKTFIDFKNRTLKQIDLSSYFDEKIQLSKKFGTAGQFDFDSLQDKAIFSYHDFFINKVLPHTDGHFLFEITYSTNLSSTAIVRINPNGNYDPTFLPVFADQGVASSTGLKLLKVNSDGSFFVTTSGVFESCPNTAFYIGDCHTLKKYLASGKLDINFGKNGIIDLPIPLTENTSFNASNVVNYLKELPDSRIIVGGKLEEGAVNKFFFSILNSDGSISQNLLVPDLLDIGQTEMIADVTIALDSKWIITSYRFVQSAIYKRILNSDLTADNSINTGVGYFSTSTPRAHIVKHLVVDGEIFFISATLNPNISYYSLNSNNYSSVSKYNIETRAIAHSNINHPTVMTNGLLAYDMSYSKDTDDLFIFTYADFSQPALKRVVYNFEASSLVLKNTFGSSGSFVSTEGYPFIRPLYSFGASNDNYIYSFSMIHILTAQSTLEDSMTHFKLTIEDHAGVAASNSEIPLNGKDVKLKMPFQLRGTQANSYKRYLANSGNLYLLFSNGVYSFGDNHNFLMKISSQGVLDKTFGDQGILRINDGIYLKMIEDKNGYLSIFSLKESLPRDMGNYDFHVQKIDNKGNNLQSFGTNGDLVIGSSPITGGQALFTSTKEHYYAGIPSVSINDNIYKVMLATSTTNTVFISYNSETNISRKKNFNFNNLKNAFSSLYDVATVNLYSFTLSEESDSFFTLFKGNKIGISNSDIGVSKFDMDGVLVPGFGSGGVSVTEVDQTGVSGGFINQINDKLQVILPYQYVDSNQVYMNTFLQIIDSKTGIRENHIAKIETNNDVILINNSFSSSTSGMCFTGIQIEDYSLVAPASELKIESFLSYLEFKNGVYTYKNMNFAGIDLFTNSSIEQVVYTENGIYLLMTKADLVTLREKQLFVKIVTY